jgi:hypothetical protein
MTAFKCRREFDVGGAVVSGMLLTAFETGEHRTI